MKKIIFDEIDRLSAKDETMGCLFGIFVAILIFGLSIIGSVILTFVTLWVSNGLFNYDLSDKFWYVFVVWFFIVPAIKGIFIRN